MKYFTIVGIIAHIAVILYLIFSFVLGDFNFINWLIKEREAYVALTSLFSIFFVGIGSLFSSS
jgi:hypothetical protein